MGHDLFTRWNKPRQVWGNGPLWRATGTLVTFHLVCLGFLLFSGRIGPTWKPASSVPPVTREAAPRTWLPPSRVMARPTGIGHGMPAGQISYQEWSEPSRR